ncbi:MAG: 4'-phosphopantetheinyl transferase superfamily protein [Muribaculaceae bacterium]|nr:4'-phosphopantetheinyl transferase superfamily protein [Muribaculaceae bacterium]
MIVTLNSSPFALYLTEIDSTCAETRREREEIAIARLVKEAFGDKAERIHSSSGAPVISIGGKITADKSVSISHSRQHAVLAVAPSNTLIGVDIEEDREQLRRVAPRILSEEELAFYSSIPQGFLKAWTLKEALYKAARNVIGTELDFAKHIQLPLAGNDEAIVSHNNITIGLATTLNFISDNELIACVYKKL